MSVGITPVVSLSPPSPSSGTGSAGFSFSAQDISLPKLPPISHELALLGTGLTTPPVEDMSTAYQPAFAAYDNHGMQHGFPPPAASAGRAKMAVTESKDSQQYYRYAAGQSQIQHQQPPQQLQSHQLGLQPQQLQSQTQMVPNGQPVTRSIPSASHVARSSSHFTRPSSPALDAAMAPSLEGVPSRGSSESLVYHSLQIPKCISSQGGNLAQFAAQMTCLFWFDSTENLKHAESTRSRPPNAPIPPLPTLARPHEQFRKWVFSVLSTTQVTQNVILLALLFIYRLKMSTPQIKGRAGSEYRLLTVALMLGNKFLDDNTYTNKTWAEVSCFAVQEIHVMEVEFLSNMRYNLLASKEDWEEWLLKLSNFRDYYERSINMPVSPVGMPSPTHRAFHSPLPSPTRGSLGRKSEFPFPAAPSGNAVISPSSSNFQNWTAYQANAVSPLAAKPAMVINGSRKRSPDPEFVDHPAKRPVPSNRGQASTSGLVPVQSGLAETARLPVPQLTLITNTPLNHPPTLPSQQQLLLSYSTQNVPPSSAQNQGLVSLPPLQAGMRAMSTVYQPPPANVMPVTTAVTISPSTFPVTSAVPGHPQPIGYGTPSKHHSPGSLAPFVSSPLADFGPGSAVHTPVAHTPISSSPSVYLQQRESPYKPIRHVNTLLYPPPSASLDQYHLSVPVQPTQMHYQPLGRRNDVRTGVVPEYVLYNRGQQLPLPSQGPPQGHFLS